MTNNTTSVRFTLNFAAKTIVGTKASFDKASKGFGPVYEELAALMAKHPTYGVEIKEPKKPAKDKRTYAGMDIDFIKDFFAAIGLVEELDNLDKALAFAGKNKMSKYPLAKRMLFDAVPEFDYVSAKDEVAKYRYERTLERAGVIMVKGAIPAKGTAATENVATAA